jgi:hypothetical protein
MLLAYGYDQSQLDAALRRRFLAWLLLHQYSDLLWYFSRLPEPASPTLNALADCGSPQTDRAVPGQHLCYRPQAPTQPARTVKVHQPRKAAQVS